MKNKIDMLAGNRYLLLGLKVKLQDYWEGMTRIRDISWEQGMLPTRQDCFSIDWGGGAGVLKRNALGIAAAGIFVEAACSVPAQRHRKQMSKDNHQAPLELFWPGDQMRGENHA